MVLKLCLFDTIALSGSNTSLPHGVPSDKKVESGEFVLMDFEQLMMAGTAI